MGPHYHKYLIEHCKSNPFSLGVDGSNDTGVEKMNPVTIRIFDVNQSKQVTSHFYDLCTTSGEDCGKAAAIFNVMDEKFQNDSVPWMHAVSLSVDNTNSMIGRNNSIASRCKARNPNIFVAGCPCHLAHIAATEANDAFSKDIGLNVENVLIDLYYWFDKSSKRKGKLLEYFEFCDQDYQKILKHVSTRWLSLECCIERALKKFPSLKLYFLSESFAEERFKRLNAAFSNPLLEPVLLFHSASIQLYTEFNKFLQRSEPTIHVLQRAMLSLARKIANRNIKPQFLKDANIENLNLDDEEIFRPNMSIFLGGVTKATLDRFLNEGEISGTLHRKFFSAARCYFQSSLYYILRKFPLNDELIRNTVWVDVPQRLEVEWENVQYFYDRYETLFTQVPVDTLYEEFCDYQTLSDFEIGEGAWQAAKVVDSVEEDEIVCHYRVDVLWWHIGQMQQIGNSALRFRNLSKVAHTVLVIPHSNAEEERLFSIVRKNKTDSRSSLKLDGTLSNILAIKLANSETTMPCYKWKPDTALLESSKKATATYNRDHST